MEVIELTTGQIQEYDNCQAPFSSLVSFVLLTHQVPVPPMAQIKLHSSKPLHSGYLFNYLSFISFFVYLLLIYLHIYFTNFFIHPFVYLSVLIPRTTKNKA